MRNLLGMAILTIGVATAHAGSAEITGDWETNQGPVTISKRDDGSYAVSFASTKGIVVGTLERDDDNGDLFSGSWIRYGNAIRCATEKEGSPYWGGFRVRFHTPEVFTGIWSNCDTENEGTVWTGGRPK